MSQAASGLPAEHRGYSGVRAGRRCHGNRDGESNDHGQVLIGASVAQENTRRDCDRWPRLREGRQNGARLAHRHHPMHARRGDLMPP